MSGYKGLHLRVETPNGYKHGIGDGQGGIYTAIQTTSGANCMVVRKSLPDFSEKNKIEVITYSKPVHTKDEIMNLIKYALVEDIRFNSSAEFINWAILGKKIIKQNEFKVIKKDSHKGLIDLAMFVGVSTATAVVIGYAVKKLLEKK